MISPLDYEIHSYTDIQTDLRDNLWNFLNTDSFFQKMKVSSDQNRPANEGIAEDLFDHFGNVFTDRVKMCIGYLIMQIMENKNYHWVSYGNQTKSNPIFNKGSKYSKQKTNI